jgi:dTDP-glucose 4,6-dehydratase
MGVKRVLITGAGSFVGHHIVAHLLENTDWEIVGTDSWRHKGVSERLTDDETYQANKDRVSIFTHDLTTPLSDQLIYDIGHIDYIIQNASESHVDRSITDPVPFVLNNVGIIMNMLEYAKKVKPDAFICIGTDEEFGPAAPGELHKEWDTPKPSNSYSASKGMQALACNAAWETNDLNIILTKTMNICGERQDKEKFIPKIIKALLEDAPITVHGTPDNVGSRFYLHARNQADAQLFILKNLLPPTKYDGTNWPDAYNVVGEREVSNLEMVNMIARIMGKTPKIEFVDFHSTVRGRGHDLRYALDGTKLKKLGWVPPVPFEESLERLVKWTLKNEKWLL